MHEAACDPENYSGSWLLYVHCRLIAEKQRRQSTDGREERWTEFFIQLPEKKLDFVF
jgi:hypothetical protein